MVTTEIKARNAEMMEEESDAEREEEPVESVSGSDSGGIIEVEVGHDSDENMLLNREWARVE